VWHARRVAELPLLQAARGVGREVGRGARAERRLSRQRPEEAAGHDGRGARAGSDYAGARGCKRRRVCDGASRDQAPSLARLASSNLDAPQRALLRGGAFGDDNARSWGLWAEPPQSRPALSSTDAAKSAETAATTTQPGSHSISEPQFVRLYCSKCWFKGLVTYSESKWMVAHGTRRPQLHGNPLMHPVSKATRAVRYPEPRRAIYRP
jgi:hypothetical protein